MASWRLKSTREKRPSALLVLHLDLDFDSSWLQTSLCFYLKHNCMFLALKQLSSMERIMYCTQIGVLRMLVKRIGLLL